ncbi:MAG: MFS transporter [Chloroflexi bacterium]|nr:MFS transporter [Chloroflexota bacterium]
MSVSVAPLRQIAEPFSATGYRSLGAGAVLTATAMWVERVAIGWYIFQATDSAFLTSAAVSAQMGSGFFFGPIGGAIADRSSRPRVLSLAITGRALTIVGLALLTAAATETMAFGFVLLAIGGVAQTLHFSSLQTLSADLVGVERRASGISLVSIGQRAVSAVGALGSGFMVTALGPKFALAIAAVLTGLGALAYARIREPRERNRIAEVSLLKDTVEGLRIVGRVPLVAILLGLMIVIEVFGYSFFALTPAIADRVLGVGVEGLGGLNAATPIGGVFALLFLAAYSTRLRMGIAFAVVYLLFGAMIVVVGASPWYSVSLLAAAGIGACAALVDALEWIMLQGSVDDRLRGRALGAWNLTIGIGWIVGPLTMGAFADAAGVTTAFTMAGLIVMVTAVAGLALSSRLRTA